MTRGRRASGKKLAGPKIGSDGGSVDRARRTEILKAAAAQIATSGLRTSLQDIAKAAGVLAGSLYHHFDSKEAILIELIERFYADLDRIGHAALARVNVPGSKVPIAEQITALALELANCAVEHRAALQLTFYEPPGGANQELVELARRPRGPAQEAMLAALRAGQASGEVGSDIDLPTAADRICATMLHVGLDVIRHNAPADRVAGVLCQTLLHGLASRPPSDAKLDASPAMIAVSEVVETWTEAGAAPDDKAAHVRAVARAEFGRRGYEATTIRDIAAAAGLGIGTVYRLVESKEALLASIMESQGRKVAAGWAAAMRSDATPLEKLDALSWVAINILDRFPDEFKTQLAWLRQEPPDTSTPGWLFNAWLKQLSALLTEGIESGEIRIDSPSKAMLARCIIDLVWIPENILTAVGKRASLILVRDTMLRGVMARGSRPARRPRA